MRTGVAEIGPKSRLVVWRECGLSCPKPERQRIARKTSLNTPDSRSRVAFLPRLLLIREVQANPGRRLSEEQVDGLVGMAKAAIGALQPT